MKKILTYNIELEADTQEEIEFMKQSLQNKIIDYNGVVSVVCINITEGGLPAQLTNDDIIRAKTLYVSNKLSATKYIYDRVRDDGYSLVWSKTFCDRNFNQRHLLFHAK